MTTSKEKRNDLIGYLESIIEKLTPTQKILANYLIGNLDEAAFLSADEMAKKIDKILKDEKFRDKIIEKGKANIKRFSWEKSGEEVAEILVY